MKECTFQPVVSRGHAVGRREPLYPGAEKLKEREAKRCVSEVCGVVLRRAHVFFLLLLYVHLTC